MVFFLQDEKTHHLQKEANDRLLQAAWNCSSPIASNGYLTGIIACWSVINGEPCNYFNYRAQFNEFEAKVY